MANDKIQLSTLKDVFNEALNQLQSNGIHEISLDKDYYWLFGDDSLYNVYENSDPVIGQLSEDLEYLEKSNINKDYPVSFILNKISHLVRFIARSPNINSV